MMVAVCLASAGLSFAGDNTPTNVIPPKDDYGCHRSEDDGHIYCSCEGESACELMEAEGVCDREVIGDDGTGFTMDDTDCFDIAGHNICVCTAERVTRPGTDHRPDRATTPTTAAPGNGDDIVVPNNRARRNEAVRARRGEPAGDAERVTMGEVSDGTSKTLKLRNVAVQRVAAGADAPATVGSIFSDEAPPEVLGIDEGDNVTDHREPGQAPDRAPNREPRPTPRPSDDPGSEDSDRQETPPAGANLKGGLGEPSDLAIRDVTRTTLTLSWQDNSTHEFGVEVYRIDPVKARRERSTEWEFVGTFEERVQSRVAGTGERSDQDLDLAPDTNYCYRLRSYRGFDRSAVSLYSKTVCAKTEP